MCYDQSRFQPTARYAAIQVTMTRLDQFVTRWPQVALCGVLLLVPRHMRAALPDGLSAQEARDIERSLAGLGDKVSVLRTKARKADDRAALDLVADAEVFHKGVVWALRYESKLEPADIELIHRSLAKGHARADALAKDSHAWSAKQGLSARGFVSAIDGSSQPYGLLVPAGYDPRHPYRLDVVLHGSSRPVGLSELRFIERFDEDGGKVHPISEQPFIELHPLGRVENCYRWAGETDVFEAIEAVSRHFSIDRDRIVLRGMSMGASGTWHLGLKRPDYFVALGPYCGYVDTHRFSQTSVPNFVKIGALPEHQELALHMLDSVDYAANAGVVPAIACMGEKDVFFDAHQIMAEAMRKDGLQMVNLISPGTGHMIDPVTHREQLRLIGAFATNGVDRTPRNLRFVTWTLKYASCHWMTVLGLQRHYARAELAATLNDDGSIDVSEPINVTSFALTPPPRWAAPRLRVGDNEITSPGPSTELGPTIVVTRREGRWVWLNSPGDESVLNDKRPALQGPIDDAFTSPFLCVRGTERPWSPKVQAWADASLRRFAYEWHRYFRGELPIKDDVNVTNADRRRANLVLFGDPGSNRLIRESLPSLPVDWTPRYLEMAGRRFEADDHAPILICPSPLAGGERRYLVINSGHTFHEPELAAVNYLLFPRLGDWAAIKIADEQPHDPSSPLGEEVLEAGFFNEQWRFSLKPSDQ